MIKFDIKRLLSLHTILLILGLALEIAALVVYNMTGVNEFNATLSSPVLIFAIISIVLGSVLLILRVLSIDEVKVVKLYLDLVIVINFVVGLFAFMFYVISQVNYLANVLVSIDGTKISFTFVLTVALFVLAFLLTAAAAFFYRRESKKEDVKAFNKSVFRVTFTLFLTLLAIFIPGLNVARANAAMINNALNVKTDIIVDDETAEVDPEASNYFPSQYNSLEEVKAAGEALAQQIEESGLVLLKNDNNALPLAGTAKVSLFGTGSVDFNYTPSLSGGSVNTGAYKNFKQALEAVGVSVNETLWNYYQSNKIGRSNSVDGLAKTYKINEIEWANVNTNNSASFSSFKDAAIVVFTRDSGEGFDVSSKGSDGRNGMYLGLSTQEMDLLKGLTALKTAGTFSKVVVILNSSCPIELNFLNDAAINVDSIMWIGNAGGFGLEAVSKALVGQVNPSGKLSDTYVKNALSSPAMASWVLNNNGVFAQEYNGAGDFGLNSTNKHYGVYVEGIYVGYRYYETRYEDKVLNRSGVGDYNYDNDVAYPFGHGLSYTNFEYSNFNVTPDGDNFTVSLTVKNIGTIAGREVVQIYGQKPYVSGGLEKASIELMGYKKTAELAPNASENVEISIRKEQFKSYDNVTNKTYILDAGDYYLATGRDAHDALNNILNLKGQAVGNSNYAKLAFNQAALDKTTYAANGATNRLITNQLDKYDINLYENRGTNSVTYVSRNNWASTFPAAKVSLTVNANMAKDLESHKEIVEDPNAKEVKYASGASGSLINLRGLPYNHEKWDSLLDQLTYEEQALLITNGAFGTSTLETIALPATKASDGPNFITSTATNVALPSEGIWASAFDTELMAEIGDYLAEDARINGLDTLYAPGINIHRTPFIGRSHEYFSEDPYLTGISSMNQVQAMEARGVVTTVKHFAFNDEESARNGISVWLNEQAAREIYLTPFEYTLGVNYGNAHGCMSGFNRAGTEWVGASSALQEKIAREEWGFEGYYITDMASSNGALYMTFDDGIMAGTNIYLGSGSKTALKAYKSSLTFKNKVREATHRILYVIVNHDCVMNGISQSSRVISITPWWDTLLNALIIASIAISSISLVLIIIKFPSKKTEKTE